MEEINSAEQLITHLRQLLESKGDFGLLILDHVDAAIAEGIEERVTLKGEKEEFIGRRPPSPAEVLDIFLKVLRAYLFDLPKATVNVQKQLLEDFERGDISINFAPDLLSERGSFNIPERENINLSNIFGMSFASEDLETHLDKQEQEFKNIESLILTLKGHRR